MKRKKADLIENSPGTALCDPAVKLLPYHRKSPALPYGATQLTDSLTVDTVFSCTRSGRILHEQIDTVRVNV